MAESDDFMDIYQLMAALQCSRATVWNRIRYHGVTTYRAPGERRTLVRCEDLVTLRRPRPRGMPEPIVEKRGGYRGPSRHGQQR